MSPKLPTPHTPMPHSPFAVAVRAALEKNRKLHAWQLVSESRSGLQTYLVKTQLESDRQVEDATHTLTVYVRNGDKLGHSSVSLEPADTPNLAKRIDEAAYMASLGGD